MMALILILRKPLITKLQMNELSQQLNPEFGDEKVDLSKKFTTEDLWGVQLTFDASNEKEHRFIDETTKLILQVGVPATASDKRGDQELDTYKFSE
jgi:hypothetical protein